MEEVKIYAQTPVFDSNSEGYRAINSFLEKKHTEFFSIDWVVDSLKKIESAARYGSYDDIPFGEVPASVYFGYDITNQDERYLSIRLTTSFGSQGFMKGVLKEYFKV